MNIDFCKQTQVYRHKHIYIYIYVYIYEKHKYLGKETKIKHRDTKKGRLNYKETYIHASTRIDKRVKRSRKQNTGKKRSKYKDTNINIPDQT